MEGRVALAQWGDGRLTLFMNSQAPHYVAEELARCLGLPQSSVRMVTGFVGGAFGAKYDLAEEEMLTVFAARRLGRPVKWTESRREHLAAIGHGRSMSARYRLVADRDGRVQAYTAEWLVDLGCRHRFLSFHTVTPQMGTGNYDIGLYAFRIRGVWTNRSPRGIYRGAGRPEATLTIERAMDHLASELGIDPAEVRRRNFVPPDRFPYESRAGYTYDSGDYAINLDKLLEVGDYEGLRRRQLEVRSQGGIMGVGIASYVEICGFEDWGAARVIVSPDGSVTVAVETLDQGQGHRTVFAQIVSERLGLPMAMVRVEQGDTSSTPPGWGTAGSRSLPQGGSAAQGAAIKVADKAKTDCRPAYSKPPPPTSSWSIKRPRSKAPTFRCRGERSQPQLTTARCRPEMSLDWMKTFGFAPMGPTFPSVLTWLWSRSTPKQGPFGSSAWWRLTTPA